MCTDIFNQTEIKTNSFTHEMIYVDVDFLRCNENEYEKLADENLHLSHLKNVKCDAYSESPFLKQNPLIGYTNTEYIKTDITSHLKFHEIQKDQEIVFSLQRGLLAGVKGWLQTSTYSNIFKIKTTDHHKSLKRNNSEQILFRGRFILDSTTFHDSKHKMTIFDVFSKFAGLERILRLSGLLLSIILI